MELLITPAQKFKKAFLEFLTTYSAENQKCIVEDFDCDELDFIDHIIYDDKINIKVSLLSPEIF